MYDETSEMYIASHVYCNFTGPASQTCKLNSGAKPNEEDEGDDDDVVTLC